MSTIVAGNSCGFNLSILTNAKNHTKRGVYEKFEQKVFI